MNFDSIFGGRMPIIPTSEAMRRLKISKAGIYKWIKSGKIKQREYQWGGRVYKGFKDTEIDELARKITRKGWKSGKALIKEEK